MFLTATGNLATMKRVIRSLEMDVQTRGTYNTVAKNLFAVVKPIVTRYR